MRRLTFLIAARNRSARDRGQPPPRGLRRLAGPDAQAGRLDADDRRVRGRRARRGRAAGLRGPSRTSATRAPTSLAATPTTRSRSRTPSPSCPDDRPRRGAPRGFPRRAGARPRDNRRRAPPRLPMADLFDIVDAGFLLAEEQLRPATFWWHPLPDGREAAVAGDRLLVAGTAQDAYVYETPMAAVLAAARWIEAGCAGEPDGWTRHPATGRTRFDGARRAGAGWSGAGGAGGPGGGPRPRATGRTGFDGARRDAETAWVCPRHPDRLPRFDRGRLFCVRCGRVLVDAIRVPWPPRTGAG